MSLESIWILVLSLFLLLLLLSLIIVVRECFLFTNRYCVRIRHGRFFHWFRIDWDNFRAESESRSRIRQLRREHREHLSQLHLFTFSQIPGVIPDSNQFDIILSSRAIRRISSPGKQRNLLTPEQRRTILEYLLNCHPYPIRKESLSTVSEVLEEKEKLDRENSKLEQSNLEINMGVPDCNTSQDLERKDDRNIEELSTDTADHDEHIDEDTCAICLEQFLHGELINSSNACQHFFHKECLLGWLDQHNICPCCRVTMIPENQWELAIKQKCIPCPHQQGLHDA